MSFTKLTRSRSTRTEPLDGGLPRTQTNLEPPTRPRFNYRITSDRLREGSYSERSPFSMLGNIKKGRKSVFREVGLEDHAHDDGSEPQSATSEPEQRQWGVSEKDFGEITGLAMENEGDDGPRGHPQRSDVDNDSDDAGAGHRHSSQSVPRERRDSLQSIKSPWYSKLSIGYRRPRVKTTSSAPPPSVTSMQRFTLVVLIIAIVVPSLSFANGRGADMSGVDAGVIRPRQSSPTEVCTRWAHQVAQLNGTLYIYGGQAKTEGDQELNTWNRNFLTLDLQQSWETDEPRLRGLPIPDGPPAVSLGYLWQDYNNLYLYGGQFADNDGGEAEYATPDEMALWRYSIRDEEWTRFRDPETSAGNYSTDGGIAVQRAAEGAGLSVPELGLSWYFGGHLDVATTRGWSIHVARLYLSSLLEWTHPGYGNNGVEALRDSGAGEGGVYRNITEGGTQEDSEEFPERADAVLVFVPGWGRKGVLIGLGGGANDELTENMEELDVFDIETSEWYHQETTGDKPPVRVNPCAVIASAPDASSFQIYLFGGQDLPFGNQTQYNDMYILTIPAFHWIRVDEDDENVPYPRAGHTCTMRDGQMIMVGGYVGEDIECDSPGIYVFNASSLRWTDRFVAGDHDPDINPDNSVLAGSWGYRVPRQVQSVIGGNEQGSATASTPESGPATGGPFATGTPPVFTITESGATATVTQPAPGVTGDTNDGSGGSGGSDSDNGDSSSSGTNAGLIAAGVAAGLFAVLAIYLGWCAWVYRRQVAAYRQHLAVANRYSGAASQSSFGAAGLLGGFLGRNRTKRRAAAGKEGHRRDGSVASDESFSWVGAGAVEPKWMTDGPSPGSGSGTGTGTLGGSLSAGGTGPSGSGNVAAAGGVPPMRRSDEDGRSGVPSRETDRDSLSSTEQLLEGQEPSFFSVVLGPRRALRVVNGMGDNQEHGAEGR